MKFTIIVPAFNEDGYVRRAIESLRKQVLGRDDSFEIIVVDNGSTDGTVSEAKMALGGTGKVIIERNRRGPNEMRQRGVEAVDHAVDVFCFLDADCRVPSDWLLSIKREIQKGAVAVSGPYLYNFTVEYQKFLNTLYSWVVLPFLPFVLRAIFWRKAAVVIGGNFAVTREALQKIGGIPPIRFWGDDAVIAMLLVRKVGRVKFSPHVWAETSPRRYEKNGFWTVNSKYTGAYFRAFFSDY